MSIKNGRGYNPYLFSRKERMEPDSTGKGFPKVLFDKEFGVVL
jgi:hypothetical protein